MRKWLLALLLGSAYLAVYSAAGAAGFVYEDRRLVNSADAVISIVPATFGGPRSLTLLSFHAQDGSGPLAHHATNIGLHAAVAALVGIWLRTSGLSVGASFVGAALLLLHPMSVESAAYVGGRFELIAALFLMAACCLATLVGRWAIVGVPGAVVASLLAGTGKEAGLLAAVFVPVALVAKRRWISVAAFVVFVGVAGVVVWGTRAHEIATWVMAGPSCRANFETSPCTTSGGEWLRWQATAAVRMLGLVPTASGNSVVFDVELVPVPLQWLSVWWLAALALVAVWLAWRCAPAAAGLAWVLAVIAPRLVVPTSGSVFNEHQFYTAMPGVALVVAALWDRFAPAPDREWNVQELWYSYAPRVTT